MTKILSGYIYPPAYHKDKDIVKQSIQKCKKGAEPAAAVTIYRVPFRKNEEIKM